MDRTLGLRIKRARESLRWTQKRLAAEVGVTQKTVDNWEHDKTSPRSAVGALERVLGVDLSGDTPAPLREVTDNWDDQRVRDIWGLSSISPGDRLTLIRQLLAGERAAGTE